MLMYYWYLTKYGRYVSMLENSKNLDLQKLVIKKKKKRGGHFIAMLYRVIVKHVVVM